MRVERINKPGKAREQGAHELVSLGVEDVALFVGLLG